MSTGLASRKDSAGDDPLTREIEAAEYDRHGIAGLSTDWSVPWSDLMMVMFVLFVVLFIYERAERPVQEPFRASFEPPKPGTLTPPLPPDTDSIVQETRAAVVEADIENIDVTLGTDDAVTLSVRGPAFFDLGKADLRPETERFLDRLAPVLTRNPYEIDVVGHTDSFPIHSPEFPTNWELSAARAARVARYLIERGGLEAGRFTVIGHSMYRPAAPDAAVKGKARNRRVEIIITPRIQRTGTEG